MMVEARWRTRVLAWPLLLLAATVAVVLVVLGSDEAQASVCDVEFPYVNEQMLIDSACREHAIDPGRGVVHTHRTLLAPTAKPTLNAHHFSDQWLWYAPLTTRTFAPGDQLAWAYCETNGTGTSAGYVCPPGQIRFNRVVDTFAAAPVTVRVFQYGGAFIGAGCGNFSQHAPTHDPVPTLEARKFEDADRDGNRDPGERWLAGVRFEVHRLSSEVGQAAGLVADDVRSDADGRVQFRLDGHGPGRYELREVVPSGSMATAATRSAVDVGFGIEDGTVDVGEFGNAPTTTDVDKVSFSVVEPPSNLEARQSATLNVRAVLRNDGPADFVEVREALTAEGEDDCAIEVESPIRTLTLRRGESRTVDFAVTATCDLPSKHRFTFGNTVSLTDARLRDVEPANNVAAVEVTIPVHADSDLGVDDVALDCDPSNIVGEPFTCSLGADVRNEGPYGPVDAEVALGIEQLGGDDCRFEGGDGSAAVLGLGDGEAQPVATTWSVTCGRRSFHDFRASASVEPTDPHVFDDDPSDDGASDEQRAEVFHDAELRVDDVVVSCDEEVGNETFGCRADVAVVNDGPAPDVEAVVEASIEVAADCAVEPAVRQTATSVLAVGAPQTASFSWTLSCTQRTTLHPMAVTADVAPSPDEPHAVDEPGPVRDDWAVPVCLPTVNPDGRNEPAAPGRGGQGQNQDGFYRFETRTLTGTEQVWVEDAGTGTRFGPYEPGVRVKYVEANGAEPVATPMAGNNGDAGSALAVDVQIRGQGDAAALYLDEDGNVTRAHCLVPPRPM